MELKTTVTNTDDEDNNLQSQQQQQKSQLMKADNSGEDGDSYVNDVAVVSAVTAGAASNNNSSAVAAKNNSLTTNYNNLCVDAQQLDSLDAFGDTMVVNNNNNGTNSFPATFELDPVQLKVVIDSVLRKLVGCVVEKFTQLEEDMKRGEEEGASRRQEQQQATEQLTGRHPIDQTSTLATTTDTTTSATTSTTMAISSSSITTVQSNQEQSNQVCNDQSNEPDNFVEQHDQLELSPDEELTSDLVIDAGDQREMSIELEQQLANSTDGDNDDNNNGTQQQQTNIEPQTSDTALVINTSCNVSEAANIITATATTTTIGGDGKVNTNVSQLGNSTKPDRTANVCGGNELAIVEQRQETTADHEMLDDLREDEKAKDMVTLRNLEISPPPSTTPASADETTPTTMKTAETDADDDSKTPGPTGDKRKRTTSTSNSITDQNDSVESSESGGRSKRQRTQTKLFQAGDIKLQHDNSGRSVASSHSRNRNTKTASSRSRKSTASSTASESANISMTNESIIQQPQHPTTNLQDVIFYEKNDYLAIRNEQNSFYLCQLTENVRGKRPTMKVKWLDTNNEGKTYFLTPHYDMVPTKSIIMATGLNKLKSEKKGEQLFSLDDQDKDNILERLKRSLSYSSGSS